MKQVLQNRKTGRPFVGEVPAPALQRGRVLVRTVASLISAGTERASVELVSKGLLHEARQRPDLVKAVVAKVKSEGLLNTFASVRDKMAASSDSISIRRESRWRWNSAPIEQWFPTTKPQARSRSGREGAALMPC